jgi:hypothetical protein
MQAVNLRGLAAMNRGPIAKVKRQEWTWRAVLGMDSTEIPSTEKQEQSAYNKHYAFTCFRLLDEKVEDPERTRT